MNRLRLAIVPVLIGGLVTACTSGSTAWTPCGFGDYDLNVNAHVEYADGIKEYYDRTMDPAGHGGVPRPGGVHALIVHKR